jgi:hypothetical protein
MNSYSAPVGINDVAQLITLCSIYSMQIDALHLSFNYFISMESFYMDYSEWSELSNSESVSLELLLLKEV